MTHDDDAGLVAGADLADALLAAGESALAASVNGVPTLAPPPTVAHNPALGGLVANPPPAPLVIPLEPVGLKRDVATGQVVNPDSPAPPGQKETAGVPTAVDPPAIEGMEVPKVHWAGKPMEADPSQDARSFETPPDPAAEAEARRKAELAESVRAASLAAGIPPPYRTAIVPGASLDVPYVFTGAEGELAVPSLGVIYWRVDSRYPGWLQPCPAMVIEPVYAERVPGDPASLGLTGAYKLQRFGRRMQEMSPVAAARPSPVPRDGYFTPARPYPPELCVIKKLGG